MRYVALSFIRVIRDRLRRTDEILLCGADDRHDAILISTMLSQAVTIINRDIIRQAGVDVTASQGEKIAEYSVFGRIKRSLYGWNFKARLDTSSDHLQSVDTYFHMEGGPCKSWLTVRGNVASDLTACRLTDIGIAQPLNLRGRIADLSTKYDMNRNLAECVVSYSVRDGSVITLGADSGNKQLLSISQRIGKHHELTPTVSTKGDMELEYKLNTDGDGVLSTNYNPKHALTLKYERWPWKSDFKIPVRDFYKVQQGARFSVRRSLESFAQM